MQIQFEYTVEDYREANKNHRRSRVGLRWLWVWSLGSLGIVILSMVLNQHFANARGTPMSPVNRDLLLLLPYLPWTFLLFPLLFGLIMSQRSIPRNRYIIVADRNQRWVTRVGWALNGVALLIILCMVVVGPSIAIVPTAQTSASPMDSVLPVIPWLVVLPVIGFVVRRAVKRAWKLQPALQRSKTFTYSPFEVSMVDDLMTLSYRWPAIIRCVEGPTIFSLYVAEMAFHMIPKRAFASPEAADGFRRLIQEWADGQSVGFPVVQAASSGDRPI